MEQKSGKEASSKGTIEKLMGLGEEDLFAILGLELNFDKISVNCHKTYIPHP